MEALEIIQGLLAGTMTNYRGQYFQLDHARLFDRPEHKPAVILAAGGVKAAGLAGKLGNGLIDPPPLEWSDLRYVFDIKEDCNGKEAIQA